jgi:hypothetical protein
MTNDGIDSPELEQTQRQSTARRTRRWLYPLAIMLVAGFMAVTNWVEQTSSTTQLTAAVTALVDGTLEGSATTPADIQLRWADDTLKTVFRRVVVQALQDGDWTITVQHDDVEADGTIPVTITGVNGAIVLGIRLIPDSETALIRSVFTAPATPEA